jgi:hypothetical protein
MYRVIQKKRSKFWEMVVSVIVGKEGSNERVSNSERLPRQTYLNLARAVLPSVYTPGITLLDLCLWGLDKE